MSIPAPGKKTEKKTYSAKVEAKADSSTGCPFCWFVHTVYPALNGMTPRDESMFSEHLKQSHGLSQEIPQ